MMLLSCISCIICLFIILLISLFIIFVCCYRSFTYFLNKKEERIKLKFSQWKELYAINPERYLITNVINYYDCFLYRVFFVSDEPEDMGGYKMYQINFNMIDLIRFWIFRRRRTKKLEDNIQEENYKKLLRISQEDINNYREKYMKEITQQIEENNRIQRRGKSFSELLEESIKNNNDDDDLWNVF